MDSRCNFHFGSSGNSLSVLRRGTLVSLFLISHGYCITCRRLSLSERRAMAVQACVLYMTLVGYRAYVPYFSVSFSNF
ncbi:hypothetical protein OROHE_003859 [Orobanche hederae]